MLHGLGRADALREPAVLATIRALHQVAETLAPDLLRPTGLATPALAAYG